MLQNTQWTYGSVAKFFHWLIVLLLLVMFVVGYTMLDIPNKDTKGIVVNIHKLTGLTIFTLMVLRSIWTTVNTKPLLPVPVRWWEMTLERTVHYALYFFLLAMPLTGWIMSSAAGHPPHFFNWNLVFPIMQDKAIAEFFVSLHNTIAVVLLILISIHVLAALYHFFIIKDNVLQRMWPSE